MAEQSVETIKDYMLEVRENKFPTEEHCSKMDEGEAEKLLQLVKQKG